MVAPPWDVMSPAGVLHRVSAESLNEFAKLHGLVDKSRKNHLAVLVGHGKTIALEKLPLHKYNWQLVQRIQWIRRLDDPNVILPIIGGDGAFFVQHFAGKRPDTRLFYGSRLNQLLNKGFIKSHGKAATFYHPHGSQYMWELLGAAPPDAEQRLLWWSTR